MADYSVSKRLDNYQYIEGCPIFITGGNLLKDNETQDMFVNIRLRSLSKKNINAVILDVECFDVEGEPLEGINRYQLLDLNIKAGETFGDKDIIMCPDKYTRKCRVIPKKVIFSDETKWEFSDADEIMCFGLQSRFSDWSLKNLTPVLLEEMQSINYPKDKITYIPDQCGKYWICTCGSINHNEKDCICGLNHDQLFEIFNEQHLAEREKDYKLKLENEEKERIRRRDIARQREEEERRHRHEIELKKQQLIDREREEEYQAKKRGLIGVSVVLAAIVIFFFICFTATNDSGNSMFSKKYTIGEKEYSTNVEYLDLSGKRLTNQDIEKLCEFKNLKSLDLSDNNISDISCLSGITSLQELNLYNNNISNISALSDMKKLNKLNLSCNNISDISALEALEKIQVLWLSYNNISDISALRNMYDIEELVLDYNKITSIEALRGKSNLRELYLNDNYMLSSFDPLCECSALEILNMSYTAWEQYDYNMLKESLPDCQIYLYSI